MRRKILALGSAVVLALAACSGRAHDTTPTTTPAPSTTAAPSPTPTTINPDVIPPVITVAYVNAVFAVLNHIGNATRKLVATHQVSSQVRAAFRSIYNDPLYSEEIQIAQDSLSDSINNVRPHPGDGVVRVRNLVTASHACLFPRTSTNLSAVLLHPTAVAASEYYELRPKQPGIDPEVT